MGTLRTNGTFLTGLGRLTNFGRLTLEAILAKGTRGANRIRGALGALGTNDVRRKEE